jgi:uncharacterized protein (DUF1800 family)
MDSQTRSDVALLHRRAGFGLRPDELDAAAAGGYEAAVEKLVSGLAAPVTGPTPSFGAGPPTGQASVQDRRARLRAVAVDLRALQAWWMDRMISTSSPLQEKLALFWHGHFATGAQKVHDARLMYIQNQLFRTGGGAGFEDLAQAVAKDGAMMFWLDTVSDRTGHPNENFAREMMELFTLGVGNYTQADVTAAARAFTGWSYDRIDYRYVFRARAHDGSSKTYLGRTGNWNGDDIVHIAVTQPASARFVVSKVWSHFAYPVAPSDPVVTDLLPAYGTGMEVGSLLAAVFMHPQFRSTRCRTGLVKQPAEWLAGAARALWLDAGLERSGASSPGSGSGAAAGGGAGSTGRTLPALSVALGQALFAPPNVGGWGQNGYWLDSATTELRLQAALALAGRADLSPVTSLGPASRPAAVADMLGLDGWGPTTASALSGAAGSPTDLVALALASPEYVLA